MSVYVDSANIPYGRMIMCHMVADTLEELHKMADDLELKRKWFQDTRHPHYDISKMKKAEALKLGAVEVSNREILAISEK